MKTFEIKDDFLVDGKPIQILSGAIHYFRMVPEHWYHSLYNLKALGFENRSNDQQSDHKEKVKAG